MTIYSISDLAKLSGVKAHTIRIWEKRYCLLEAKRTPTNIRYYSTQDLQKLLNVVLLYKTGVKISKIAKMCPKTLASRVQELGEEDAQVDLKRNPMALAILDLDEEKFETAFSAHCKTYGFDKTIEQIVFPILDDIHILYEDEVISAVHERFLIAQIKRKLYTQIDQLDICCPNCSTVILILPEGHYDQLTTLYLEYVLKKNHIRVLNLGTNICASDIKSSSKYLSSAAVITVINDSLENLSLTAYIEKLKQLIPNQKLLVTGSYPVNIGLKDGSNYKVCDSVKELLNNIEQKSN